MQGFHISCAHGLSNDCLDESNPGEQDNNKLGAQVIEIRVEVVSTDMKGGTERDGFDGFVVLFVLNAGYRKDLLCPCK